MMEPMNVHWLDGRSDMARDFFEAKSRGDKLSFCQLLDLFIHREYSAMLTSSWRMLDIVCSGAANLWPNHRLRDFALNKYRYDEMHRLDSEALQLVYEDARKLFTKLHALYDESPPGFIDYWEKIQLREAEHSVKEVHDAYALCSPGEDIGAERLRDWRNMTVVDRAVVLRQAEEKRAGKLKPMEPIKQDVPERVTYDQQVEQFCNVPLDAPSDDARTFNLEEVARKMLGLVSEELCKPPFEPLPASPLFNPQALPPDSTKLRAVIREQLDKMSERSIEKMCIELNKPAIDLALNSLYGKL